MNLNNEALIENIRLSFFNSESLSRIINMHIIGFVLITVSLLVYISKNYLSKTINSLGHNNDESTSYRWLNITYEVVRKALLYIGIAVISVMLVQNAVWIKSLEKVVYIFNFFMLSGYILILASAIIDYINFRKESIGKTLFLSTLSVGYVIYALGLFLAIKGLN